MDDLKWMWNSRISKIGLIGLTLAEYMKGSQILSIDQWAKANQIIRLI